MTMIKKVIWYVVLPIVVIVSVYLIFFRKVNVVDTNNNNDQQSSTSLENEGSENGSSGNDSITTVVDPLDGFSTDRQTVGAESESTYTLTEVTNQSASDYHTFTFKLSSENTDSPYATAEYLASSGVVRISLANVESDESGIGYQKAVSINKEGVVQLYHNISSSFTGEIYDIGVSQAAPFELTINTDSENTWSITLNVQYPGVSDSVVDLGSSEYSLDPQSITGVSKDAGATVGSYTYSSSSGVLKFAWNVSSSDTNPIPAVTAEYDSDGELVVTFSSLSADRVVNSTNGKALPGSITMESFRDGDSSVYKFIGMSSPSSYKLSAVTSPNQVVLEIKL